MSRAAARHATQTLQRAIADKGAVRIIVATGASQFGFLEALTSTPGIDWSRGGVFGKDE